VSSPSASFWDLPEEIQDDSKEIHQYSDTRVTHSPVT
jgi:hypothetical protein